MVAPSYASRNLRFALLVPLVQSFKIRRVARIFWMLRDYIEGAWFWPYDIDILNGDRKKIQIILYQTIVEAVLLASVY